MGSVQDGDGCDANLAAHRDGAGPLIDDDARNTIGFHRHALQFGDEIGGAGGVLRRCRDRDGRGVLRARGIVAEALVDGLRYTG